MARGNRVAGIVASALLFGAVSGGGKCVGRPTPFRNCSKRK